VQRIWTCFLVALQSAVIQYTNKQLRWSGERNFGLKKDRRARRSGDEPSLGGDRREWSEVTGQEARLGGEFALLHLVEMLQHEDREVRLRATFKLAELGDERAVDNLLDLLLDEDTSTRMQSRASLALGRIGDERAVDVLLSQLYRLHSYRYGWWELATSTLEALLLIGGEQAADGILTFVLRAQPGSSLGAAAAETLGEIGDEQTMMRLIIALETDTIRVRSFAARTLGAIGDDQTVNFLINAGLNDEAEEVRWQAGLALARMGTPAGRAAFRTWQQHHRRDPNSLVARIYWARTEGDWATIQALATADAPDSINLPAYLDTMVHHELISILIVDDDDEFRLNLRRLLSLEPDCRVVSSATHGVEGVFLATMLRPDVMLIGTHMPGMDGIEAASEIAEAVPTAGVILMSRGHDVSSYRAAALAGAKDFLSWPPSSDEVFFSIRRAARLMREAGDARLRTLREQMAARETTNEEETISVLMVDGQDETRDALKRLLALEPDFRLVGETGDSLDGIALARKYLPDIVMVGASHLDVDGRDMVHEMVEAVPIAAVIVVMLDEWVYHRDAVSTPRQAVRAGARSLIVLPLEEEVDDLYDTLRTAHERHRHVISAHLSPPAEA